MIKVSKKHAIGALVTAILFIACRFLSSQNKIFELLSIFVIYVYSMVVLINQIRKNKREENKSETNILIFVLCVFNIAALTAIVLFFLEF